MCTYIYIYICMHAQFFFSIFCTFLITAAGLYYSTSYLLWLTLYALFFVNTYSSITSCIKKNFLGASCRRRFAVRRGQFSSLDDDLLDLDFILSFEYIRFIKYKIQAILHTEFINAWFDIGNLSLKLWLNYIFILLCIRMIILRK